MMTTPQVVVKLDAITPTGIHCYTDIFSLGWSDEGEQDFAEFDEKMVLYLEADADAMIMPRLHLDAPAKWMDAHPDELIGFADPAAWGGETCWGGPRHASFASQLWRKQASEALQNLIRHVREKGFAPHIVGWHLGAGVYGEWHHPNGGVLPRYQPTLCGVLPLLVASEVSRSTRQAELTDHQGAPKRAYRHFS